MTAKVPIISVIVPVYNVEKYLEGCLDSIMRQTYSSYDLILIDDGSTDNSGKICEQYRQRDPRVKVIHQKNGGLSKARNTGLEQARGEYLTFIDSDDSVVPDYLEYLRSLFSYSKECAITACNHTIVRKNRRQENSRSDQEIMVFSSRDAMEEALFHQHINVSAWAKMYKKEVFDTLRYPEGRIYEDTWIFGDLLKKTPTLVFGNKCCYLYRVRQNSIVNGGFTSQRLQYIESAQKMADDALQIDKSLRTGCIRRINHARLSTLRYMTKDTNRDLAQRLRTEILHDAPLFIHDPRTPFRDKAGIKLLSVSLGSFYTGWRLYSLIRP